MKYRRPEAEVEAMRIEGGDLYLVEMPDGHQLHLDAGEFERHFQPIASLVKKGEWKTRAWLTCGVCRCTYQSKRKSRLYCSNACRSFAYRERKTKSEGQ